MTTILLETFDNLSRWTDLAGTTITTSGRTGLACEINVGGRADFRFVAYENEWVTYGHAFWISNLDGPRFISSLRSDSGVTAHMTFHVTIDGAIEFRRGTMGGTFVAASAPGLVTTEDWYYFEVKARLHDTNGSVIVRLDNIERLNLTDIDTKNAGTKTVIDSLVLGSNTVTRFDDLYLKTGAGESFFSSIALLGPDNTTITFTGEGITPDSINLYRHSMRVVGRTGVETTQLQFNATAMPNVPVLNYRHSIRVLGKRNIEVSQLFFQFDLLSFANVPVLDYRQALRVIGPRVIETTTLIAFTVQGRPVITVRAWTGTEWIHVPLYIWDGGAWINPLGLLTWNGSTWVS